MKVLQVKEYHKTMAREQEAKALQRWREKENGYGYPVKTRKKKVIVSKQGNYRMKITILKGGKR